MAKKPTPASGNMPGEMQVEPSPRKFSIAIAYSRTPVPMTRADQMTVAHLISFLSARGHDIDFYGLDIGEPMTEKQRAWLVQHCRTVHLEPHGFLRSAMGDMLGLLKGFPLQVGWFLNAGQRAAIAKGIKDVDIGYSYYIRNAETMRRIYPAKPTFVAMQLSQSLSTRWMVAHYRNLKEKMLYAVESRLVRNYEARVWSDFSRTVLIGEQDVAEIRSICREKNLPERLQIPVQWCLTVCCGPIPMSMRLPGLHPKFGPSLRALNRKPA